MRHSELKPRSSAREHHRERDHERDRDREREKNKYRDRGRSYDRGYYRSKSSSRSRSSKMKKFKKSKKKSRRSRSSSRSSLFSSHTSRSTSHESRTSRSSCTRKFRSKSQRKITIDASVESSNTCSGTLTNNTVTPVKGIDLSDSNLRKALQTIEEDTFAPSTFISSRDREATEKQSTCKVIIDLNAETVIVPKPADKLNIENEIIHPNFLGDEEFKAEKWLRKLCNFRQKYTKECGV